MSTSTNNLEKRLAQLMKEVQTRGFERYLLLLNKVSELPAELQSPAVTKLAARDS